MKADISQIVEKTWVQHLVFWMLSFIILTGAFATAWPVAKADFVYTLLFHISLVLVVYIHLRLLLPLVIRRKPIFTYLVGTIVLFIAAVFLNEFTFTHLSDLVFPGYYFVSAFTRGEIALFIGLYLILTTSLKFSKSWMALQRTRLELEESRRTNIETELMALRSQVNPHFLFNSLHSIYALALEESKDTTKMILQLSNVLRFMLYEADKPAINLAREIHCIDEFVALQRARVHEQASIKWESKNSCADIEIVPLLLMPLVDNTFKHGQAGEKTDISMHLNCEGGELTFETNNYIPQPMATDQSDRPGGIGLVNVRRRLQLSYPERHELKIEVRENAYHVILKVQL